MTRNQVVYSFILLFISVSALLLQSCSVYKTLANIGRLQYKLNGAGNITVAGISLSGKNSVSDFNARDILSFTSAVAKGNLPISFILNVDAKNPNTGSGGFPRTNASIEEFPFRLVINGTEVLQGDIASSFTVPGTGETSVIPLSISFDLVQTFKSKSYESLLNIALSLAGIGSGNSSVELFAQPTIRTEFGSMTAPNEIRIIDTQFSDR
ncbi:MAG: hypothetical protein HRU80_07260 [Ignavibacteriales bacterium]|nr:MAG: hypothetical protein HRU80_07260 [Ignavibacteriales bacterium]